MKGSKTAKNPRPLDQLIPLMAKKEFLLFSHRGYEKSGPFPENTWPAFEASAKKGFYFHELDVSLSKDHIPVLFHGPLLESTTSGKGRVKEWTLSELQKLDWGDYPEAKNSSYGKKSKKTPLLTLQEYFKRIPEKTVTNIEIKKRNLFPLFILERSIRDLIYKEKLTDRVIISSFHPLALLYFRFFAPELARGVLIKNRRWSRFCLPIIIMMIRPDSLHLPDKFLTEKRIARYKKRGYEIIPWLVYSKERINWLKKQGIRAAITGIIDLIKES